MDPQPRDTSHMRALLSAAGLDPALSVQPDAELMMALRLSMALGERLSLDLPAEAALLHYLRRIDALDLHLRSVQGSPTPRVPTTSRERPTPWHEPHG